MATPPDAPRGARISYRDLRNTPRRVWERLARDEPLTLVADGEARALLLPVHEGGVADAWDAYVRGRAMLAASRLRRTARTAKRGRTPLAAINAVIRATRAARER